MIVNLLGKKKQKEKKGFHQTKYFNHLNYLYPDD